MPPDAIATELTRLATFYGCEDACQRVITTFDLGHYVEIVLHENGFEVVTGGVGREAELIAEARALGFPVEVVDAFQQCAGRFPQKMVYSKVALGPDPAQPTMYLGLIEPWEVVIPFLGTLPGLGGASEALARHTAERRICYMLAFSKEGADLVVKMYHLAPRPAGGEKSAPFLISRRLRAGQARPAQKEYTAGVTWDDLPAGGRWPAVASLGQSLFGDAYALVRSDDANGGVKLYVFRYDKRESAAYSLKTFNYYADEGVRLYQLGLVDEAVASLTEAIRFDRGDQARLYNMLGLIHYAQRQFDLALADFDEATRLDETLAQAHNNRAAALLQLGNYEPAIYAASRALFLDPHSDPTNLDTAKRLLRQAELIL